MESLEDAMGQMNLEQGDIMEGERYDPTMDDALNLLNELVFQLQRSDGIAWTFLQEHHDEFYDLGVGHIWEGVTSQLQDGVNVNLIITQLDDYIIASIQSYGGRTIYGDADEDRGFDDVDLDGSGVRRLEF
jgi:hypothetical protein